MDMEIVVGGSYLEVVDLSGIDVDLDGYDVYMQIREKLNESGVLFGIDTEEETENGSGLELDIIEKELTITISAKDSMEMDVGRDVNCFWDLRFVGEDGNAFVLFPASVCKIKTVSTRIGKDMIPAE